MSTVESVVRLIYVGAAACFVLGLHEMNSPATARRGNLLSAGGMAAAVLATVVLLATRGGVTATGWIVLAAGLLAGAGPGLYAARTVAMTAMPQLVSLFNAVGGGAAALLAAVDLIEHRAAGVSATTAVAGSLDILIGTVTFTGSLVAAGKLQGWVPGRPLLYSGARAVIAGLAAVLVVGAVWLAADPASVAALAVVLGVAAVFGVMMVLPIGGADMPVVVSLLNACTGIAVAMAGFAIGNVLLIIAGALVGASGGILTKLMADAMNRSVFAVLAGGFGTGDAPSPVAGSASGPVRQTTAEDAAIQLGYAGKVIIVPGYGLAAAQAQHEISELARFLETRGVEVSFAIHPVAGRMPGHMNVLLADANVPYPQLKDMDEINPEFAHADVALVVGANDVTNPAARRPGNAVSGMPILDVDRARSIIVIKRSMGHGYAGIDNELYTNPKTAMLFADAKNAAVSLLAALKTLAGRR
ncbi:MAG TPA: NAD(P)(+) transhydrogenase (Re/Si-specific) subunit beta [Actinophytocola sp.]|uniref:NAD(P)(+) transhydrogenase (Re/Si-specific) subunit beta n=1 Tax=Actinophytocola sp. TaxID=1872138 RepID=UPI002DBED12C|nr:NAD(P)(+) transhydrogenase (Re/Si-specific) subunit beta [Actinophytocola sp.]HEU5469502.1 NAD(P)(+) transhydrogenase (Re/Si-specific) subunit beta [Actinophytocola sp.]